MTTNSEEDKENPRLWKIDPSNFTPLPRKTRIQDRLIPRLRIIGKASLISLAMAYPVILLTLGLLYGGIVFWGSFAGSTLIIWLVLSRLGYAENFAGWGVMSSKRFAAGLIGFPLAAGFYLGLIYLKLLALPLIIAVVVMAAVVLFRNASSKT